MPTILAIMAHPDDIEILCAGTLALLKRAGWDLFMVTMTPGDLGSMKLDRKKISAVRRKEAAASAKILGARYRCLEFSDLTIAYGEEAKRKVSAAIREARPDVIVTHAPVDYMGDHEETSRLVREAAFASTIPNWKVKLDGKALKPCAHLPAILYADPIDLKDHEGRRVNADFVVDITETIDIKEKSLAAHASQRDWLREQHGEDEYLLSMRRWGADRARDFGSASVKYAEGFKQHLGHAFPHEDVLTKVLGSSRIKKFRK